MARSSSGGNKKHGRNKVKCAQYKSEGRREKNKARHMKQQDNLQKKADAKRQRRHERNMRLVAAGGMKAVGT